MLRSHRQLVDSDSKPPPRSRVRTYIPVGQTLAWRQRMHLPRPSSLPADSHRLSVRYGWGVPGVSPFILSLSAQGCDLSTVQK